MLKDATNLFPITHPIPFARWGIDMLGPFPQVIGQRNSCWNRRIEVNNFITKYELFINLTVDEGR